VDDLRRGSFVTGGSVRAFVAARSGGLASAEAAPDGICDHDGSFARHGVLPAFGKHRRARCGCGGVIPDSVATALGCRALLREAGVSDACRGDDNFECGDDERIWALLGRAERRNVFNFCADVDWLWHLGAVAGGGVGTAPLGGTGAAHLEPGTGSANRTAYGGAARQQTKAGSRSLSRSAHGASQPALSGGPLCRRAVLSRAPGRTRSLSSR